MNALFDIDIGTMEKAFFERDSRYDGLFFTGVRTTGIFCRTTCTARKPKKENIEFFRSAKDALDGGYRPCKVCKPLEYRGSVPSWVRCIMDTAADDPSIRMKDADILRLGTDPVRLRRWFRSNYGITFQAYVRALRIGGAHDRIRLGDAVADAAFDSGYESLSGFNDAYRKLFEGTPAISDVAGVIKSSRVITPLGPMLAGATDDGICMLEFADGNRLETQVRRLSKLADARFMPGTNPHLLMLQDELDRYFAGTLKEFTVPLRPHGTEFQMKAWDELRRIPYGGTISYGEQALRMGRERSVRAVARANGDNLIAILLPCHRVVGADGKLTGYGGGLWRKKFLLDLERKNAKPVPGDQ